MEQNNKILEKLQPKDIVWEERYRPKNLDELILPSAYKKQLGNGELRNYLLIGTQGTGKTSTAYVLSKGRKTKFIDCSTNRSISMIRDEISSFCAIASIDGHGSKVIILDEIDALKADAQQALRGTIEKFTKVARFIATCNYPEKLLKPVVSRFSVVNFDLLDDEMKKEQLVNYAQRLKLIMNENGMSYSEPQVITAIIKKFYPDMRSLLQTLQDFHSRGVKVISVKDVVNSSNSQFSEAFDMIIKESSPIELYKYFSSWKSKENILLNGIQSEFAKYIVTKYPQHLDKLGTVAVLSHKYGVESHNSLDLFITMLASVYELAKTLK